MTWRSVGGSPARLVGSRHGVSGFEHSISLAVGERVFVEMPLTNVYLSPDIAQRLALRNFEVTQVRGLSEREFEVLRLLAAAQGESARPGFRQRRVRCAGCRSHVGGSLTSPARPPCPGLMYRLDRP